MNGAVEWNNREIREKPMDNTNIQSISKPRSLEGRTISWSKNGFIAFSPLESELKNKVFLTYLENVDGNSWRLAKPQEIKLRSSVDTQLRPEISLLSWSNMSTDLAVSDIHGNLYIMLAGVGIVNPKDRGENGYTASNGTGNSGQSKGNSGASQGNLGLHMPSYELTSYNHMEMIYRDLLSQSTPGQYVHSSQIIEIRWLNIAKPLIVKRPATLKYIENAQHESASPFVYTYSVSQHEHVGSCHPIPTKQACVTVRQNGELSLYYQGEHKVEYHKICDRLRFGEKTAYIEMASVGFSKNNEIIVTAHDKVTDKIRVFRAHIDWGYLVQSAKKQKIDPHYHTPEKEQVPLTLKTTVLCESNILPSISSAPQSNTDTNDDIMAIDSPSTSHKFQKLSSIDLISPSVGFDSDLDILISYETWSDATQLNTEIYRYNLVSSLDYISSAFDNLGNKTANKEKDDNAVQDFRLLLIDKMARNGKIQRIEYTQAEHFLLLLYEKGKVDVIDRKNMTIINEKGVSRLKENPPPQISSLFDIGFNFPEIQNVTDPLVYAVSPNLTSLVYICPRLPSTELRLMVLTKGSDQGITPKEMFITSVGFAFRHSHACYTNTNEDDLIALAQTEIKRVRSELHKSTMSKPLNVDVILKKFVESIICETHKAVNFNLDSFGKDSIDKLLSSPPLQKLLSFQLILGGLQTTNYIMSDIAWTILNLRSASFGIMFLLSSIYRQISKKKPNEDTMQDSITRGEYLISLIGNIQWLLDFMIYLNQELLHLSHSLQNPNQSSLSISNSLALPLILSKVPRLFLIYALNSIGKTNEILKKLNKDLTESNKNFSPMKQALGRYFTLFNSIPLNLSFFENFLKEADTFITKEIFQIASSKDKGYQLKLEQKLVCEGEIIEDLIPVAKMVIARHARTINRDIRISDIYFYNTDWLQVGYNLLRSTEKTIEWEKETILNDKSVNEPVKPILQISEAEYIDALRKIVISTEQKNTNMKKMRYRRCLRCRALSLTNDPLVFGVERNIGLWTMVFQRSCICGSSWVNCEA